MEIRMFKSSELVVKGIKYVIEATLFTDQNECTS